MHFSDDWDDEYQYAEAKEVLKAGTAHHQKKFAQIEDAYNARWQAIVNVERWMIADESRAVGWYHSVITIGPDEPKPTQTGATIHSLCVIP